MIELDGSVGEGGGQILRTSLALSMCTGQPVALKNIRAKRAKPGLMRQHLTCVDAAREVSGAQVQGAELGSQSLVFAPGPVRAGGYRFNVGTAGSCTLVLQTVWPALLLAGARSTLTLQGGTHNPMAPPFHFLERSFAPLVRRLGAGVELALRRHGFYPAGGGEMDATLDPAPPGGLKPFDLLERGERVDAYAECLAPGLPRAVAQRELDAVGRALGWSGDQLRMPPVRQNEGPGNALMATLAFRNVTEVFTHFGEKRVSAEQVAASLLDELRCYDSSPAPVGPHLADQWAVPLALAVWQSGTPASYACNALTEHSTTNFDVISRFLPVRFETASTDGGWRVSLSSRP